MPTLSEKTHAGAALLDAHKPGWYRFINTKRLDISNASACIIGQLNRKYPGGLLGVCLTEKDIVGFGFDTTTQRHPWQEELVYRELRLEWRDRIAERWQGSYQKPVAQTAMKKTGIRLAVATFATVVSILCLIFL